MKDTNASVNKLESALEKFKSNVKKQFEDSNIKSLGMLNAIFKKEMENFIKDPSVFKEILRVGFENFLKENKLTEFHIQVAMEYQDAITEDRRQFINELPEERRQFIKKFAQDRQQLKYQNLISYVKREDFQEVLLNKELDAIDINRDSTRIIIDSNKDHIFLICNTVYNHAFRSFLGKQENLEIIFQDKVISEKVLNHIDEIINREDDKPAFSYWKIIDYKIQCLTFLIKHYQKFGIEEDKVKEYRNLLKSDLDKIIGMKIDLKIKQDYIYCVMTKEETLLPQEAEFLNSVMTLKPEKLLSDIRNIDHKPTLELLSLASSFRYSESRELISSLHKLPFVLTCLDNPDSFRGSLYMDKTKLEAIEKILKNQNLFLKLKKDGVEIPETLLHVIEFCKEQGIGSQDLQKIQDHDINSFLTLSNTEIVISKNDLCHNLKSLLTQSKEDFIRSGSVLISSYTSENVIPQDKKRECFEEKFKAKIKEELGEFYKQHHKSQNPETIFENIVKLVDDILRSLGIRDKTENITKGFVNKVETEFGIGSKSHVRL